MTTSTTQRPTAQSVFDQAFQFPRQPRSDAYKAGVLAALRFRLEGARIICPYANGTAESDAYYAGIDEGHRRAREAMAEEVRQ